MKDLRTELISLLEAEVPELRDRILTKVASEPLATPYATFFIIDEMPMQTMPGVTGFISNFEVVVYEQKLQALEKLKHRAIAALESKVLAGFRCSFKSSSTSYCPDQDTHGITLIFRIL